MTKSVSNIVTASTVVAVAATAINQAEALNDRQHRLRTLQEGGEDASASLSMLTNVESINNLINDEEPKFQEKKKEMDIGILMSSVMSKNSELADKVSQALDQMGGLDKQELVEKVDELVDLVKHFLHHGKSGKSKSGKGSKASGDDEGKIIFVCCVVNLLIHHCVLNPILSYPYIVLSEHSKCPQEVSTTSTSSTVQSTPPFEDGTVSRYAGNGSCSETSDCLGSKFCVYCYQLFFDLYFL